MRIVLTPEQLVQVENLVRDFMNSFYPDIDVSQGTPLDDILVQGFKVPIGLLQSIANRFRETRSLAGIQRLLDAIEAADPTDPNVIDARAEIDDAVTEVLANWFIERRGGQRSAGLVTLHLTSNEPFPIPVDFRAFRTIDLPFLPLSGSAIFVDSEDMTPVLDSDGVIVEYTYRLMMEAEEDGNIGDIAPGTWEAFDQISPFLSKVTSDTTFSGGLAEETTSDLIERAQDGGVTERTLHNSRALNARFAQDFPQFLPVTVVGAGDPEMQRDLLQLGSINIHRLNHWNVYVGGNVIESKIHTGLLGDSFVNPRTNEVEDGTSHQLLLPSEPILLVREIRWKNVDNDSELLPYTDSDGYVRFDLIPSDQAYTELNQAKRLPLRGEESYSYQNSAHQTMVLEINPETFNVQGQPILLTYDTIDGFQTPHNFLLNLDERPGAGDPLAYSYYPVVVSFDLEYVRRVGVTAGIDVLEARRLLTSFIRQQRNGEALFANRIAQEFLDTYGDIALGVKPLHLNYYVWLPNGCRVDFTTTDRISMSKNFIVPGSFTPTESFEEFQLSDKVMYVYTDEININIIEAAE